MQKNEPEIQKIIESLESILTHPRGVKVSFGNQEHRLPPVAYYLDGIRFMCSIMGMMDNFDKEYANVLSTRGWELNSGHPSHQMMEKGLSYEEMTKEIVAIELQTWKQVISKHKAD